MSTPRVVSLLPSATEIVHALGLGASLVGRSHECDFPPEVESLPICTRAGFPDGTSREIDDRVVDLVTRGLSLYEVDTARLRELQPQVVLTQDQCRVCAVHLSDVEDALAQWTGGDVQLVSLAPTLLGDVWRDIVRIGNVLGAESRAQQLSADLAGRLCDVGEKTGAIADPPAVVCLEWIEPLMSAGNWVPELVSIAGGRSKLAATGAHSPAISWAQLRSADPDVLIVTACGFDLARTRSEMDPLLANPEWRALRAVRQEQVYLTDGNAYFNRSGPRLADSLEILAEILHPARFNFGYQGRGWDRL